MDAAGNRERPPPRDKRIPRCARQRCARARGASGSHGEHYEGGHWLGTFAIYLTTRAGLAADRVGTLRWKERTVLPDPALLKHRKLVRTQEFLDELEVSRATFKRDLEYLRDRMRAPIVYDREEEAYKSIRSRGPRAMGTAGSGQCAELQALLTMDRLLGNLERACSAKSSVHCASASGSCSSRAITRPTTSHGASASSRSARARSSPRIFAR